MPDGDDCANGYCISSVIIAQFGLGTASFSRATPAGVPEHSGAVGAVANATNVSPIDRILYRSCPAKDVIGADAAGTVLALLFPYATSRWFGDHARVF